MITVHAIKWEQFKEHLETGDKNWLYRGHATEDWKLESTLSRFLNNQKNFLAQDYYYVIASVLNNEEIKINEDFSNLTLPNNNPFKLGLLVANEQHNEDCKKTFEIFIKLRHLEFPSPLLDWTKDPYVAAFFAISNQEAKIISITRIRIKPKFNPFELQIISSDFYFQGDRHSRQKSSYTLAIRHDHSDTLVNPDKKVGPVFHIGPYEHLDLSKMGNVEIEKYVITDSNEIRVAILNELYEIKKQSFEHIYGKTHVLENTVLKDLAFKTLILKKH